MTRFFLLVFVCLFSANSLAKEVLYLGRSPKGMLMGNAYTSYATDEYALFYNPALIGRNDGVHFTPLNPSIGVTNILDDLDRFSNFPSDAVGITDRILGVPIYIQTGLYPGLKMGPFAFNLFANQQTSMVLRNRVHPTLSIDYRLDRGFMFGGAFSIGSGAKTSVWDGRSPKKKRKSSEGYRWSYGFAVKNINRSGISGDFDLFGTDLINLVNGGQVDSYDAFRRELGFAKGDGWGVDLGVDFIYSNGAFEFGSGLGILDVGDTRFEKTEGEGDVPIQRMNATWGTHILFDFGLGELAFTLDVGPLNQGLAAGRLFHMGAELSLPIISLFAGYNEGYLGYGFEMDIWVFKVQAGLYSVEVSSDYKIEEGKRGVITFSLFDVSI
jgi:hypothetical protein